MIQLTRLNNHPLAVNSDLIKFIEQAPDTVITLVTGEKILVLESAEMFWIITVRGDGRPRQAASARCSTRTSPPIRAG